MRMRPIRFLGLILGGGLVGRPREAVIGMFTIGANLILVMSKHILATKEALI
jgi:hypothetical protein